MKQRDSIWLDEQMDVGGEREGGVSDIQVSGLGNRVDGYPLERQRKRERDL